MKTPRDPTVPPSTFEGMRGGQFYINQLTIVDAFGQTLEIVLSSDAAPTSFRSQQTTRSFTRCCLTVWRRVTAFKIGAVAFRATTAATAATSAFEFQFLPQAGDNPIAGWILPNHLDSGLSVYDPTEPRTAS